MPLRYLRGDYYSDKALANLAALHPTKGNLCFEQIVPKSEAMQKSCEESFKSEGKGRGKAISVKAIAGLFNKYWQIAVITRQENSSIAYTRRMPDDSYKTRQCSLFDRYVSDNLKKGSAQIVFLNTVEQCDEIRKKLAVSAG